MSEAPARRSADLLRLLGDVIAATQTGSADAALTAVLAHVCSTTGWAIGHVWRVHDSVLSSTGIWYPPDPEGFDELVRVSATMRLRSGEGLPGRVLADRRAHWIADLERDANFPRLALAHGLHLHSAIAFPVALRDEVFAVLEFFSRERAEPDTDLLAVMASVGAHLGQVFDRLERERILRESAARFRALADNAAEAIVTIDSEDRIHYVNPATARVFGYSAEELLSMSFSELMPEEYRARHRIGIRRYAESHVRRIRWDGIELAGLHRDGHVIPVEVTFGEFAHEGRQFFNGIMRDITERKLAESERVALLERERTARAAAEESRGEAERRARQERALRQAAAAVASAFTVEDASRQIALTALEATHADGAFVQQIDIESGELRVIAVAGDIAPPLGSTRPYVGSAAADVVESEEPLIFDHVAEDGGRLHPHLPLACGDCSAAVIPLLDAGEPIGSLILLRRRERSGFRSDELGRAVTFGELASLAFRKIHLLEDSERKRAELEGVMESRARLVRGFSHDVRNPLGAVDGYLELLRDGVLGELNDRQVEHVDRARRSLGAALGLIDDLLDLARAEAGELDIRPAPTDVREAAREIAEEYQLRAEAARLRLDLDLPADFPVISCDPARVRQVIGNLLSNAVKYTPAGGHVRVSVRTESTGPAGLRPRRDGWVVARVDDTGPGIPHDHRELLFQEFVRLDPDAGSGIGIGLAISRRIALALGGNIIVDSEPGRGSTFELWLPLTVPGGRP